MKIDEIKKMPLQQRIQIMEQIWNSLIEEDQVPDSPQWHKEVLEFRRQKIEPSEANFLSIDELRRLKSS